MRWDNKQAHRATKIAKLKAIKRIIYLISFSFCPRTNTFSLLVFPSCCSLEYFYVISNLTGNELNHGALAFVSRTACECARFNSTTSTSWVWKGGWGCEAEKYKLAYIVLRSLNIILRSHTERHSKPPLSRTHLHSYRELLDLPKAEVNPTI